MTASENEYGDRPEVQTQAGQVVQGAELTSQEVRPGTFSEALGSVPLADEEGDGIEIRRADVDEFQSIPGIQASLKSHDSVTISLWRDGRCTTLERSWEASGETADYLDAFRQLGAKAEELIEDDHL